jgi:acyl-homoserine lactone acylase PvdQ
MGSNRKRWAWGKIHRYVYRHPGAKGKIAEWLLNRGPYPAPGNCTTINVSGYVLPSGGYEVNAIPSMRFIADMGDDEKSLFCCPMGQSGQPGHRHYDDMIDLFRNGGMVPLYLSREKAMRAARRVLKLTPSGS